jgi:hypothetical protein
LAVHDGHALEPLAQKAHSSIDLVQTFLAVGVLGILGAIALSGGFGDRHGDSGTFVMPQPIEFIPQPLGSFGSDVLGTGRSGGAIS